MTLYIIYKSAAHLLSLPNWAFHGIKMLGRIMNHSAESSSIPFLSQQNHSVGSLSTRPSRSLFQIFLFFCWLDSAESLATRPSCSIFFSTLLQFFLALHPDSAFSFQFIPIIPKTIQNIPIAASTLFLKVSLKRPKTI